ncbi:3' terminal RNA ribose 2'-O-methyltransferase Hen1 [Dulcicalothrix desertica PCC 7102]|uniref:Small RNA 2'-O-methyltransferase n=1 Tax=Dulcicalothrix desertica PCC 7102 TaxID=232991 RepID=A0A3S1AP99_9CYAN|nr:3' terminal RNA ribose 2'-O-methyltransferase Hen1 [Dulcicalothrix desertica]RUT06075.1 3' terminal RNA ribose 2'-O-methyltransferase Hen1 [Dulcicalothrix desertica PCC 7102]TWH54262.1 3' terminal RNA ribose 2'-O-methyltransferase Hen1 [Dulcicalothrix desertica PCC 7102]
MLLTITTTHTPATDLGYLLHKHPDKCQSFSLSFGQAHVFYPEASDTLCTAALLLDIDAVKLVRSKGATLEQYVNDRPYVASSFFSVAMSQVFGTALGGRCKDRPELVQTPIPLTAKISVLPCRGGEEFLRELFEPLGYTISAQNHQLDEKFPDWGASKYYTVELQHTLPLSELLSHLYVLIPVLDDEKHYWVGEDEVEKLLRHGEGWLSSHPAKEQITRRYLKRQGRLTRAALAQLVEQEDPDPDSSEEEHAQEEAAVEKPLSLNKQRMLTVVDTLKQNNLKTVIDLGCGEGTLLRYLIKDAFFDKITGVDVSYRALGIAKERIEKLRLARNQWDKIQLFQSALTYQDKRFKGYDAVTLIEVIEHLDLPRLSSLSRVVFEFTHPKTVIVTTPNIEYNVKFETLPAGKLRHKDHRFEWTREEFQSWANQVAQRFNYTVEFQPIGDNDNLVGAPTQMAVFKC